MTHNNETLDQNLENTAATEPIEAAPVAETENNEVAPVEAVAEPEAPQSVEPEAPTAEEKAEEPQVDYSSYSREQLVDAMRALLEEDITTIRSRVTDIRNRFSELTATMQQQTAEQPAEQPAAEGEEPKTDEQKAAEQQQEQVSDPVYDAFRTLYARYRSITTLWKHRRRRTSRPNKPSSRRCAFWPTVVRNR